MGKCGNFSIHTGAMGKIALRDHKGFTLIELLAVMAIVAVLAGIVSVTVSGFGESSRDTQTKQDATTIQSAAADFFSAQVGAETLRSKTVTLLGQDNLKQIRSTRWPEDYISSAYAAVFPESNLTTVASIIFLDKDGTLSDLRAGGLVQRFNAIDFNALQGGEFLATLPENADRTTKGFNDYLWLLEKGTAAGGSSEGASRKVAVFKLVSVEISETSSLVDLTYRRLVGEDFSDELPVALTQSVSTNEDMPKGITLKGIDADTCELTFIIASGPFNGGLTDILDNSCVAGDPNADSASVTYAPNLNFNGEDSFTYTVIDGNGDDIATVTVTINVVNDDPTTTQSTPVDLVAVDEDAVDTEVVLSTAFDDVDIATNGDSLTYVRLENTNSSLVTATIEGTGTSGKLILDYLPDQNGSASITVKATDGDGSVAQQTFNVTVDPVNDDPTTTQSTPVDLVAVNEDAVDTEVVLSAEFDDVDIATNGDSLTYVRLENTNSSLVAATIEGTGTSGKLILDYLPDQNGSASITVKATDGDGSVAQQTFEVTVNAVPESINEDFSGSLSIDLQDADTAYTIAGGVISKTVFGGGNVRSYIRTVDKDFNTVDFVAELTFTTTAGQGTMIHFFGLGPGDQDGGSFSNESAGALFRIHSSDTIGGRVDAGVRFPLGTFTGSSIGDITTSGDTHRARITKSGNLAVFAIDRDFTGTFVADITSPTLDLASVAPFLNNTNSRIYFGTASATDVFDDLLITVTP